jgi:hypothetical protein
MGTLNCAASMAAIVVVMSAPTLMADEWVRDPVGNMLVPPVPAMSDKLFDPIDEAKDPTCPRKDDVIRHYIQAETSLKSGNVKLLIGDLPQAFADTRRARLHMKPVTVSAVVAQPVDLSSLGGGAALDVTEFGTDGCAFTRTIMPAAIWAEMLKAAAGIGV